MTPSRPGAVFRGFFVGLGPGARELARLCGMHDACRWICVAFWSAIACNTPKLLALA
ncbi:MAG: hypothetical protein K8T20_04190 [Planctomycetes bacterium]|nr:hypothetical protein [Planctomycetota bacterium]